MRWAKLVARRGRYQTFLDEIVIREHEWKGPFERPRQQCFFLENATCPSSFSELLLTEG